MLSPARRCLNALTLGQVHWIDEPIGMASFQRRGDPAPVGGKSRNWLEI
jgi:hypothetical protein